MEGFERQGTDSWNEWRKFVLNELTRYSGAIITLDDKINELRIEVAMLKVKASLFGSLAGLATTILLHFLLSLVPVAK